MKPVTSALDIISHELDAHPDVSQWIVQEHGRQGAQLYLIGVEPEAVRQITSASYEITIYRDHSGGRGETTFSIGQGELGRLNDLLTEAVFMAGLSASAPFTLPAPAKDYPQVELVDPQLATPAAAAEALEQARKQVNEALRDETGVRLSSMELYINHNSRFLRSSTGVVQQSENSELTLELVLTAYDGVGHEAETFTLFDRRRLAELDLPNLIKRRAQQARDSLHTKAPKSGAFPVVIDAKAMLPFFNTIRGRSAASAKYRNATTWDVGQPVVRDLQIGSEFDSFDLISDATLPYGLESRAFDSETLPGQRFTLIKDGVLRRFWATARYAQYLDLEPTGALSNVVLGCGSKSRDELLTPQGDETIYYVIDFSWLTPDAITGGFSGEIRLGYEITAAGITPIRGGAVTGNVISGLTHAHFSRESVFLGSYQGPAVARFATFSVAGE